MVQFRGKAEEFQLAKPHLELVIPATKNGPVTRGPPPKRRRKLEVRVREYLTGSEVDRLIAAAGKNRHGHRDLTLILIAFRHGLRPVEAVGLRWDAIDFDRGEIHIARVKRGILRHTPFGRPRAPGSCAVSSVSNNLSRHSCLRRSVVRHLRPEDLELWSRVSVKRLDSTLASTLTCSGMRAVTRLPIKSIRLARCRRISVIAISNTPSGTLSFHQRGSRISGVTR